MRRTMPDPRKSHVTPWAMTIAVVVMGLSSTACSYHSWPISEADYPTKIVGSWQGTVGNSKETMSIKGDGTFVCQLHPMGFISNMLFPGAPGTVGGSWTISGPMMTLNITSSENEHLRNRATLSTIISFKENELVLKSDRGDTSSFQRVRTL